VSREDVTHAKMAAGLSEVALEGIYADLSKQNLRDYSNNEVRWKAGRLKAIAAERRRRKPAKEATPPNKSRSTRKKPRP
jgi:hypothetical protein